MTDGLSYFKKVYNNVPDWVQIMHDYNPLMLNYYTDIRGEAFKDGCLSAMEKDEFIASLNAGRLYERSMRYHTYAGIIKGASVDELIEYFLVAYVYKGKKTLELSLVALQQTYEDMGIEVSKLKDSYNSDAAVVEQLLDWTKDNVNPIVSELYQLLVQGYKHYSREVFETILQSGYVARKRKLLNLVGQYITELNGAGAKEIMIQAKKEGVTEEELAELGYIVMITAGIPSWFELSDHLQKK